MTNKYQNIEKIIEELAELEHKRWSSWQRYCHDMILKNGGKITSPYPFEQWERQIKTPYSELSEKEKESDRKEARNTLKIIKKYITQVRQETIQECIEKINKFPIKEETKFGLTLNIGVYDGYFLAIKEIKSNLKELLK